LHHLIFDTCVWVDLAVSEFSLVAKLGLLIQDGKAKIVVPEIIRTEWDGCKKKIVTQITEGIVEARRSAISLKSFMDEGCTDVFDRISSVDPISTGVKISAARIQAIEEILDSDATIRVPVSDQTKTSAVERAVQKKSPFRSRNSMADALIFLTAVEWVSATKPDRAVFLTHNTKDFSDDKRGEEDADFKNRLAPDLRSLADKNRLGYGINVGRVLNDVEQSVATEEEIEHGEAVVERTRAQDDWSMLPRARTLELQKKFDEMRRSGPNAIPDVLIEQMEFHAMSSGVIADVLKQQEKFQEMTSGPIADVLKQRVKLQAMSSGAIADVLKQQEKFQELISSGPIADVLKQWREIS
jgi:hypothetical protein